jgi:hypothetical protein
MLSGGELEAVAFAVGQLIETFGEALGGAAGVDEDDGRVVFLN